MEPQILAVVAVVADQMIQTIQPEVLAVLEL
jgi:hypothetical protein